MFKTKAIKSAINRPRVNLTLSRKNVWVCICKSNSAHMQDDTCEVVFVISCSRMCGETHVEMFGIIVTLHM